MGAGKASRVSEDPVAEAAARITALMVQMVRDVDAICNDLEERTGIRLVPPSVLEQIPRHTPPSLSLVEETA